MGKYSKKLVVYLDQNFLSEMAKVDSNDSVNPQFKNIYELLHQGFIDEKTVVPRSFFHDVETSLAPHLKERITRYQGYLGQVQLQQRNDIETYQAVRAAKEFSGEKVDAVDYRSVFHDDPDHVSRHLNVRIDLRLGELFDYRSDRRKTAEQLTTIQRKADTENVSYREQLKREIEAHSASFLEQKSYKVSWVLKSDPKKLADFVVSDFFKKMPIISIYGRMWAKMLVDYRGRKIKSSDATDVDIVSTYLPYVDVLATDNFMANMIRNLGLDREYSTQVFGATKDELNKLDLFLSNYLTEIKPVNIPDASVFVLPDERIKKDSWEFFRKLGSEFARCDGQGGKWVKLYAFNRGDMPRYANGMLPFYGIQNIKEIEVGEGSLISEIIEICKQKSRSNKFLLIDSYRDIPDDFSDTFLDYCLSGKTMILGYKIYQK